MDTSEADVERRLADEGLISLPAKKDKVREPFKPIRVSGEPVSETLIRERGYDPPKCDRPGCFDAPLAYLVRPNPSHAPWGSFVGGNLPPPSEPPPVVHRCRRHLHEEGHFTPEELAGAADVVEYFLRQATARADEVREQGEEALTQAKERVLHFHFVLSTIQFKRGPV